MEGCEFFCGRQALTRIPIYMKKLLYLLLFLSFSFVVFAQTPEIQLGNVPMEDVKMTSYAKDPEAEAVVLYNKAIADFVSDGDGGFNVKFIEKKRIKILNKEGLGRADIAIRVYNERGRREKITELKAYSHTITDEGYTVKQLTPDKVFEEDQGEYWKIVKFAIPNVNETSVIEYEYTKISPLLTLPDWEFQSDIPVIHSEYTIHAIPFYEFVYILQGANRFDYQSTEQDYNKRYYSGAEYYALVYTVAMQNQPAFRDESFITSKEDYITKIDWQLSKVKPMGRPEITYMTSWPEMVERFQKDEDFGKYIKASERAANQILKSELNLNGMSEVQKAQMIERYVKDNFQWNGGHAKFAQQKSKDFTKSRQGWSSDINLFLTSMYRAAGLEAYPIVLSTRDHGKIKDDYPFISFFNTVAAMVKADGRLFLTDGTEPLLKFGKLPPRYLNEKGLVIKKGDVDWVDLNITSPSLIAHQLRSKLNTATGKLSTEFMIQLTDYDAVSFRRNTDRINSQLNQGYELQDDIQVLNADSYKKPLMFLFNADIGVDQYGDTFFITPFLGEAVMVNPFKQKSRNYPIDFIYQRSRQYSSQFEIPEGYTLASKPEDLTISNPIMDMNYQIIEGDGRVTITANYKLKKAVYSSNEYVQLRNFYGQMVDKFNEQLEIKKTE